jgi:hypothetical protein
MAVASACVPAWPQTNDAAFRHWEWTEPSVAARSAGLADAFVALADDAATLQVNPAGLVRLPSVGELQLTPYARARREVPSDGTESYGVAVPFAALTVNRGRVNAFGFHYSKGRARYGSADEPLETSLASGGITYARRIERLTLGLGLGAEQLRVDSYAIAEGTTEVVQLRDRGRIRLAATAGVIWQPRGNPRSGDWTIGASLRYRHAPWRFERTAYDEGTLTLSEPPASERMYAPSILSAGAAWRPPRADGFKGAQSALSFQGDWLFTPGDAGHLGARYGFAAEDYRLSRGFRVRGGGEIGWPLWGGDRPWVFQVRAGADWGKAVAVEYTGADADEGRRFAGGASGWRLSLGASMGLITLGRLHVAASWRRERDFALLFGLAVRYPGLFP